jgi:hypothetical protein
VTDSQYDYYDDFVEGYVYEPFIWRVSSEDATVLNGCLQVGELHREDGTVVAESSLVENMLSPFILNTFKAMRARIRMPDGLLHAKETIVLHAPAREGDALRANLKIKAKYEKNGRRFVVLEHDIRRTDDDAQVMTLDRLVAWVK